MTTEVSGGLPCGSGIKLPIGVYEKGGGLLTSRVMRMRLILTPFQPRLMARRVPGDRTDKTARGREIPSRRGTGYGWRDVLDCASA